MLQLLGMFAEFGYAITYATTAARSEFSADLESLQISSASITVNDPSFDAFVTQMQPDIVLFDRFMTEEQFGWRVAKHCPHAIRVLDTEDLHCLRYAREAAVKDGRTFRDEDLTRDVAFREIAAIMRSDLSLMISSYEMALLQRVFKVESQRLHYIPFLVDKFTEKQHSGFNQRQHFVSIGNFLHAPNRDAVHYLKREIWPLIKAAIPNAEMHVYGAYAAQKDRDLHDDKTGFLIKGRAVNAHDVISKARVMLAPLRFGAGLKGKLLDAMQCGTPSVTTAIGAEAMHADLPWPGAVADEPKAFARAASELYRNQHAWQHAQERIGPILSGVFSKELYQALFEKRLRELISNIDEHRAQNFMGSMLMHHTLRSTEYMARWIEVKNGRG